MKLLGWMHNKFRENGKETLKDAKTGKSCFQRSANSSLDDKGIYPASCAGSKCNSGSLWKLNQLCENSFPGCIKNIEENFEDETTNELFHGFLAIGTLGSEPSLNEPATPTFSMSLGNPTEDNAELTENDMKLTSDELEKFLEAEAEAKAEEGFNQSAGRNTDTTNIASVIKPLEGANTKEDGKIVLFPLQGYFLGSSTEFSETKIGVKMEQASIGELFQGKKIKVEKSEERPRNTEIQTNPTHRSPKHLIKKLLKKVRSSTRSIAADETDSASTKKKFQKIIQSFHRKIHPESSIVGGETNSKRTHAESSKPTSLGLTSKKRNPTKGTSERWIQFELHHSGSVRNGEQWIKTDADYYVLEL